MFHRSVHTSIAVIATALASFSTVSLVIADGIDTDVTTSFLEQRNFINEEAALDKHDVLGIDEGEVLLPSSNVDDEDNYKSILPEGDANDIEMISSLVADANEYGDDDDDDGSLGHNLRGSTIGMISADSLGNDEDAIMLQVSSDMQRMLNLVNRERTTRGIGALCFNNKLNQAALDHSRDMSNRDFFSHTGSDGSSFTTRLRRRGYRFSSAAENIAIRRTVDEGHISLMNSPGHKRNILNPDHTHFGLGLVRYTRGRFQGNYAITQVFGSASSEGCSGGGSGGGSGFSKKFMIIHPKSGKALDVAGAKCDDRTNVHLWTVNRSSAQIFHYHYASKAIVNVACNKAIDISAFNCSNGANIFLYHRNGTGAQKFVFYSDDTIGSDGCRNKVIDLYKGHTSSGTNIQSWDRHGGDNQKWRLQYV